MVQFIGGEILAEVDKKGVQAQALFVQPSGLTLYHGLADVPVTDCDPKIASSVPSHFVLFPEAIGWGAFLPLGTAYPLGPDTVPEGTAEKTAQIEKRELTVTTTRLSRHRISFGYRIASIPVRVAGIWDGEVPAALPDDFPVKEWKHKARAVIANLREARAIPPVVCRAPVEERVPRQ